MSFSLEFRIRRWIKTACSVVIVKRVTGLMPSQRRCAEDVESYHTSTITVTVTVVAAATA